MAVAAARFVAVAEDRSSGSGSGVGGEGGEPGSCGGAAATATAGLLSPLLPRRRLKQLSLALQASPTLFLNLLFCFALLRVPLPSPAAPASAYVERGPASS